MTQAPPPSDPAPQAARPETPQNRLRRLRMRSWRRGMREMDLLLGPFADAELDELAPGELDVYERFLSENDQDLYLWVTGARGGPDMFEGILRRIVAFHAIA